MLKDYDYELPAHLIAQYPLEHREDARLLVVNRKTSQISPKTIRDFPALLNPGDCLVLNDTRVLPARLVGHRKPTGGNWEGLFIRQTNPEGKTLWTVLGKTRGMLKPGDFVTLKGPNDSGGFDIRFVKKNDDGSWLVEPMTDADGTGVPAKSALETVGWVPLPPYIRKGKMSVGDKERYQTVFAAKPGAVAAPTAGLHFTPQIFETIKSNGVEIVTVTLHVGIGTFKPMTVEHLDEHPMHSEWCSISESAVQTILERRRKGGRIIAVGTTSVRVLESASQDGTLKPFEGETSLFIRPPYQFRSVDALLTNFHFPRSTLLVLVQTFGGNALIQAAYRYAIENEFRFYSYGDAMVIH